MAKKSDPAPPTPADPTKTIAAQTASNEATARLQAQLGMVGSYGPGGSVTYKSDPNSPAGYSQFTNLDPSQQGIYNAQTQAQQGALNTANDQIGRINSALGQSLTPPQLQESYGQGSPIQTSFNTGPGQQYSFDQGPGVQSQVGPTDFSADREAVTQNEFDRARSRLDPMWSQAEDKNRLRLSNQGLGANSTAYQNSEASFGRAKNDAYDTALSSAIRAGSDQQQRMFDQAVQQGAFRNQAAGQQYAQNMGAADFGNQAANTTFGQNQALAGFGNAASAQQAGQNMDAANFGNAARQQNFSNLSFAQNTPINQFATLMGTGGSVQMPTAYSGPTPGVNGTDVAGVYAANDAARNSQYQTNMANRAASNQALGGLAGAVLGNWQNIF